MTGAALVAAFTVMRGVYRLEAALSAEPGEIVAVMGPSGAGKSTLLGAIAGLVPLASGAVVLDGRTVETPVGAAVAHHERGTALLGQDPRLFPTMSVLENVAFGARARRTPKREARADAGTWLERVGLGGTGDRRTWELSGGQQQRVALARALAIRPRLLLLDEPFSALDPGTAAEIRDLLSDQLLETGTTALLATQDPADASAVAHRLLIIEHGRIVQDGLVSDVLRSPRTPFGTLLSAVPGRSTEALRAEVIRVEVDESGVSAHAVTRDGSMAVLHLPAGTPITDGATIVMHAIQGTERE